MCNAFTFQSHFLIENSWIGFWLNPMCEMQEFLMFCDCSWFFNQKQGFELEEKVPKHIDIFWLWRNFWSTEQTKLAFQYKITKSVTYAHFLFWNSNYFNLSWTIYVALIQVYSESKCALPNLSIMFVTCPFWNLVLCTLNTKTK